EIVPIDDVIFMDWSVEEAMSFVVTGGTTSPETVKFTKAPGPAPGGPPAPQASPSPVGDDASAVRPPTPPARGAAGGAPEAGAAGASGQPVAEGGHDDLAGPALAQRAGGMPGTQPGAAAHDHAPVRRRQRPVAQVVRRDAQRMRSGGPRRLLDAAQVGRDVVGRDLRGGHGARGGPFRPGGGRGPCRRPAAGIRRPGAVAGRGASPTPRRAIAMSSGVICEGATKRGSGLSGSGAESKRNPPIRQSATSSVTRRPSGEGSS